MKINSSYLAPVVHPFEFETRKGKWKYVLTTPLKITFPKDYWGPHQFADRAGKVWSATDQRDWTISEGYAWDGATLVPDFPETIAASCWHDGATLVPDFPETIAASCWHDAASQFRHLPCIKPELPGVVWNARFAEIIRAQGASKIAALYHLGLALGNPIYHALGSLFGKKPTGQCIAPP